ncbi:MAG TPA: serine/threonine protein kinase, partial [Rudaea sp.]|nr:serine/threonine protein kinase [Rudaea sp.]
MKTSTTPYANLSPDVVLAAVESVGLPTDGRLFALNSFENRVYQVGIEDAKPIV